MNTVKLYGTGSATANAVASVQIPSKSRIRGLQICLWVDSITDNAQVNCEVSRASAREIGTNGAQQSIAEVSLASNFLTSGLAQNAVNTFLPVDVSVAQGQLIYLHALVTGTATFNFTAIIHYA